jgi:hypothetical protein
MASKYKPAPCRRCGAPKQKREGYLHSWYCEACAKALSLERNRARNLCGGDHAWWPRCEQCERMKKARQHEAAARGAANRRKNYPQWQRPENWDRYWSGKAHGMVVCAIRQGLLPKLDGTIACTDCGAPAKEYDHRDYGRPLDVQPVCRSCNKARGTAIWPSREHYNFPKIGEKKADIWGDQQAA